MRKLLAALRHWLKPNSSEEPFDAELAALPTITDASEEYRDIIQAAEREAEELLEPMPRQIGWDHACAVLKKDILRKKYGLNWKGWMYDGRGG